MVIKAFLVSFFCVSYIPHAVQHGRTQSGEHAISCWDSVSRTRKRILKTYGVVNCNCICPTCAPEEDTGPPPPPCTTPAPVYTTPFPAPPAPPTPPPPPPLAPLKKLRAFSSQHLPTLGPFPKVPEQPPKEENVTTGDDSEGEVALVSCAAVRRQLALTEATWKEKKELNDVVNHVISPLTAPTTTASLLLLGVRSDNNDSLRSGVVGTTSTQSLLRGRLSGTRRSRRRAAARESVSTGGGQHGGGGHSWIAMVSSSSNEDNGRRHTDTTRGMPSECTCECPICNWWATPKPLCTPVDYYKLAAEKNAAAAAAEKPAGPPVTPPPMPATPPPVPPTAPEPRLPLIGEAFLPTLRPEF